MFTATVVSFIFADQDYEYVFAFPEKAMKFAEDMRAQYGVEVTITEREV